jgi:pimeloyl-ACP methyl ester carboxylesterase
MNTTPQLRPMSLGDLFDTAFRLYREHFVTFVGIVALLQVPLAIVRFTLEYVVGRDAMMDVLSFSQRSNPLLNPGAAPPPLSAFPIQSFLTFYAIVIGIALLQGLLVQSLLTGALANAISRSYLGRSVSILGAYRLGWRSYIALVVSALVLFLIGAAILALFIGCSIGAVIAFATTLRGPGAAATAGLISVLAVIGAFLLMSLVVLFFFVRFILTTQAIVLEHCGPLAGLGRSWRLVGGAFWRAFVVFILVILLSLLISLVPAYLVIFLLGLLPGGANSVATLVWNQAVATLVSQIGLIISYPLLFSIYTLLYYDLRIRKEGYDIEVMAQQTVAS